VERYSFNINGRKQKRLALLQAFFVFAPRIGELSNQFLKDLLAFKKLE
jgi:hypothetical protein